MTRYLCLLIILFGGLQASAQVFTGIGGPITDFAHSFHIDSFPVKVSNLPKKIDDKFGLAKVCITIVHPRISDLKVELLSPNGASIWLTNRNGHGVGENYINTCFRSDGKDGYIHQTSMPTITGEFIPDGRMEFLNNGQNPNGIWYLLVQDLQEGIVGSVSVVDLYFENNPQKNNLSNCSTAKAKIACECPQKNKDDCELLPDLVMLKAFTKDQIKFYPSTDSFYGSQIRFAAAIANIGYGPLEVFGKNEWFCKNAKGDSGKICPDGQYPRQTVYQNIYYKKGNSIAKKAIKASTIYYDNKTGHNHYHIDDWVAFRLLKIKFDKNGKQTYRKIISTGAKISFCLFDFGMCNSTDNLCNVGGKRYGHDNLPNYGLGGYASCSPNFQGISVGAYDNYGMFYEGQSLNVPKGLSGKYYLEIEVDPFNFYKESNENNNKILVEIKIN